MAYQVLARKWRPTSFDALVGQEHVLQALTHALDTERLHHAYLFTGTRGVGKTTIARILARCLNCDTGVSATPCGECSSCLEISEGRSVDLIEVDAASRTKVEDTRELLENVQYAPTRSRFKVYLIDEVHMLSGHSFNALLKTLEEPPEHVKFLLATTDPQKLPATVLSRCLQFNLKNLSAERIAGHLRHVLDAESVSADEASLWLLGRAAQGSMRDALSLTDQAIGFGNGELRESDVATMLGSVDRSFLYRLLDAVLAEDGSALLDACATMSEQGVDFADATEELCSLLHRLAVAQTVPGAVSKEFGDAEQLVDLAGRMSAEDVQLFYQFAVQSRARIAEAPEPRAAFEMLALRLLAFRPVEALDPALTADAVVPVGRAADDGGPAPKKPEPPPAAAPEKREAVAEAPPAPNSESELQPRPQSQSQPEPKPESGLQPKPQPKPEPDLEIEPDPEPAPAPDTETATVAAPSAPGEDDTVVTAAPWYEILEALELSGSAYNIASHCEVRRRDAARWELVLEERQATLLNDRHRDAIVRALGKWLGHSVDLAITLGTVIEETPAERARRLRAERQRDAVVAMREDPRLQRLLEDFDGELIEDSVSVIDERLASRKELG